MYKITYKIQSLFKNTSNELLEFEVKNATYISSTKMKNSGINLTKYVKDIHIQGKQTKLMKEIKD